jgi:predicted neutral ceramidase superfamily lipid hydrolase
MAKNSSKASFLPLLIAAVALVLSIALSMMTRSSAHAFIPHLIGYVLTPIVVALCMGWDAIDQRKKTKEDPWFEKSSKFSLILRVLTGLSFVAAYPHIVGIATDIAEKLAA